MSFRKLFETGVWQNEGNRDMSSNVLSVESQDGDDSDKVDIQQVSYFITNGSKGYDDNPINR